MHDLWADLRGHPAPHSGKTCGARTQRGTPCRADAATCGWHKGGTRPPVDRAAPERKPSKPKGRGPRLAVSNPGPRDCPYRSRRLRHLNAEPDSEWDGGPDGDGGEPMPVNW